MLASDLESANWRTAKYSICATSGPPLPAATAFCSAVYCLSPVPALTRLTLTFGYFFSKPAATSLIVPSHAQTVMLPPLLSAAVTSAAEVPPPLEELEDWSSPLLPQAVSASIAAVAAAATLSNLDIGFLS